MAKRTGNLARLAKGTYSEGGEVLDKELYDSAVLAAATLVHRLFTVPIGGGGKTLDRTNNTVGGMMPMGQNLSIRALKLYYVSVGAFATVDIQVFYTFLRTCSVEILIPGKDAVWNGTLMHILGAPVLAAITPTVAGDSLPFAQSAAFRGIIPLNTPIVLAAMTPYEVRLTCNTASGAGLDGDFVYVSLCGTLQRAS
jgi:hypothetical protein